YEKLKEAARKLGGYYSRYRGQGAIPGFIFRDRVNAQAFAALASEGDTQTASDLARERRNTFEDDRRENTVERLRSMANLLHATANESLNEVRKENTARRAEIASRAQQAANENLALAETMSNVAAAIEADRAPYLGSLRTKVQ